LLRVIIYKTGGKTETADTAAAQPEAEVRAWKPKKWTETATEEEAPTEEQLRSRRPKRQKWRKVPPVAETGEDDEDIPVR
jgi:hypothetical protein